MRQHLINLNVSLKTLKSVQSGKRIIKYNLCYKQINSHQSVFVTKYHALQFCLSQSKRRVRKFNIILIIYIYISMCTHDLPHISIFLYDRTDEGVSHDIHNDKEGNHRCYGNISRFRHDRRMCYCRDLNKIKETCV